jgi:DNA-binding response OmpR family regulator
MMLDLMMPRMDGFEVLRELRRGAAPRPGHIIVMSAHANSSDRAGITELGADQFLSKPFTLEQLKRALDAAKKA